MGPRLSFLSVDTFQTPSDYQHQIAERFEEARRSGRMYASGFMPGQKVQVITDIHGLQGKILKVDFVCGNFVLLIEGAYLYGVRATDCRALCPNGELKEGVFPRPEAGSNLFEGYCFPLGQVASL